MVGLKVDQTSQFFMVFIMNKTVSSLVLPMLIATSMSPAVAASLSQHSETPQPQPSPEFVQEPIVISGFGDLFKPIKDAARDIETTVKRATTTIGHIKGLDDKERERQLKILSKEQRLKERQTREAERQRREAELAAARRAATAQQLEEVRQRRAAFDSMTPEQQQQYVYMLEKQKQQNTVATLELLGLAAEFVIGGKGSGYKSSSASNPNDRYLIQKTTRPTHTSTPTRVQPIGGDRGLFGGCQRVGHC